MTVTDVVNIMTRAGVENATMVVAWLMCIVSVCAFFTSLVTEALKVVPALKRAPTKLVCYVVALCLTPLIFLGYAAYKKITITWYLVVAVMLLSFVVAKIAMGGWDDLKELTERMFKKG